MYIYICYYALVSGLLSEGSRTLGTRQMMLTGPGDQAEPHRASQNRPGPHRISQNQTELDRASEKHSEPQNRLDPYRTNPNRTEPH